MNLFRLQFKLILKNKVLLFWIMIFPMALSTFLKLAIGNAYNADSYDTINLAVVESEDYPQGLLSLLEDINFTESKAMFNITKTNLDNATELLTDEDVSGYLSIDNDEMTLTIKTSGIDSTIIKSVLDQYLRTSSSVMTIIIASGGTADAAELAEQIANSKDYLKEIDRGLAEVDLIAIYFYAIIGMAVLYGGFLGTNEIQTIQANLSAEGARVSVSPMKRFKLLMIKMGSANLLHFIGILLLIAYLNIVLDVVLASNIALVLLISLVASITGVWFGAFTAISLRKASIGVKIAITSTTGVLGGMLAGMMSPVIKYWVINNFPYINYINPANLINEGLYSLYYYPTTERYFFNLIMLVVIAAVFIVGTLLIFRRDNYESI